MILHCGTVYRSNQFWFRRQSPKNERDLNRKIYFPAKKREHQDRRSTDPETTKLYPFFQGPLQGTLQLTIRVNPIILCEQWRMCKLYPFTQWISQIYRQIQFSFPWYKSSDDGQLRGGGSKGERFEGKMHIGLKRQLIFAKTQRRGGRCLSPQQD